MIKWLNISVQLTMILALGLLKPETIYSQKFDDRFPLVKSDSIIVGIDSLLLVTPRNNMDSLNLRFQYKVEGIQSKIDTLNPLQKPDTFDGELDSLRRRLTLKIDSLTSINLNDNRLTHSLDSLRSKLDSLKALGPIKELEKAEERLESLKSGVSAKMGKVEDKINSPLGKFAENGANVPGSISLAGSMGNIPGTDNLGLSPPGVSGMDLPSTGVGDLGIPDVSLGENMGIPSIDKPDIGNIDELNKVRGVTGEIGGVTGEIESYTDKIKNSENLSAEVESRASAMVGVGELGESVGQVAEIKKWQSDPDYLKEMAQTNLKMQSVNHFAGHEEELQAAIEQLDKLKLKYAGADEAIDMFRKRQNFVKEKPSIERLVPGINLQVASNQNWRFDFNPYLGYRISTRFTSGLGWNERLSVNFKERATVPLEYIHGPRSYIEFQLKENFMVKAEAEVMNTIVTSPLIGNPEPLGRAWVWSYFGGFKNVFNFSKHLKGHVQVLYNLHDPKNRSPYESRFNIRFGFEFVLKKKPQNVN